MLSISIHGDSRLPGLVAGGLGCGPVLERAGIAFLTAWPLQFLSRDATLRTDPGHFDCASEEILRSSTEAKTYRKTLYCHQFLCHGPRGRVKVIRNAFAQQRNPLAFALIKNRQSKKAHKSPGLDSLCLIRSQTSQLACRAAAYSPP